MIEPQPLKDVEPTDQKPRVPWGITDAMFGFVLVAVGSLIAFGIISTAHGSNDSDPTTIIILSSLHVLMVAAVWWFGIRKHRAPLSALGITRAGLNGPVIIGWAGLGLGISLVAGALYAVAVTGLGIESLEPRPVPETALGDGSIRALTVGILVVVGPLAEEVFFRGFLLMAFVQGIGVIPGLIVTSAIFAVSHGDPAVMLPVFASGVSLSVVYLLTRSIWPSVVAHSAQNYLAVTFAA